LFVISTLNLLASSKMSAPTSGGPLRANTVADYKAATIEQIENSFHLDSPNKKIADVNRMIHDVCIEAVKALSDDEISPLARRNFANFLTRIEESKDWLGRAVIDPSLMKKRSAVAVEAKQP
jgi:hypothetical protein